MRTECVLVDNGIATFPVVNLCYQFNSVCAWLRISHCRILGCGCLSVAEIPEVTFTTSYGVGVGECGSNAAGVAKTQTIHATVGGHRSRETGSRIALRHECGKCEVTTGVVHKTNVAVVHGAIHLYCNRLLSRHHYVWISCCVPSVVESRRCRKRCGDTATATGV